MSNTSQAVKHVGFAWVLFSLETVKQQPLNVDSTLFTCMLMM